MYFLLLKWSLPHKKVSSLSLFSDSVCACLSCLFRVLFAHCMGTFCRHGLYLVICGFYRSAFFNALVQIHLFSWWSFFLACCLVCHTHTSLIRSLLSSPKAQVCARALKAVAVPSIVEDLAFVDDTCLSNIELSHQV